jgi:hypothetical protein
MPSQKATQSISENQVRMDQPEVITIIDYNKDHFVMMNPTKQFFWSGTTDEFVREMTRARDAAMREKVGSLTGQKAKKKAAALNARILRIDDIMPLAGGRGQSPATTPRSTRCASTAICSRRSIAARHVGGRHPRFIGSC